MGNTVSARRWRVRRVPSRRHMPAPRGKDQASDAGSAAANVPPSRAFRLGDTALYIRFNAKFVFQKLAEPGRPVKPQFNW